MFAENAFGAPAFAWSNDESGVSDYTRGNYAVLPTDDAPLETNYSAQDVIDVSMSDDVWVDQGGTGEYMVHQFKDDITGHLSVNLLLECKTTLDPSASTVYLQIYNYNSAAWETIDSDNTSAADTDFNLMATISDTTNYTSGGVMTNRVYQSGL